MMKRAREDGSSIEVIEDSSSLEVAKCLIHISNRSWGMSSADKGARMFECKTCGRAFTSFQALGGHRASHHKKPRLYSTTEDKISEAVKARAKTNHECSICGVKFSLGQALGGHMRRHRVEPKGGVVNDHADDHHQTYAKLVRSLSKNKRVICMDLNLTPLENDLQHLFGKKVDCKPVFQY